MRLISSQIYRNREIVAEKLAARDFIVSVSPIFEANGEHVRAILDGHHSLAAAEEAGVAPQLEEVTDQECDFLELLNDNIEDFLRAARVDSNWFFIDSGCEIW